VAICSRQGFISVRRPFEGTPCREAGLEITIGDLAIAGVYFPLASRHEAFWDDVFGPYAMSLQGRHAVLIGDWNTGSRSLDIGGTPVPGMDRFDALVASGWTDAWRSRHPGEHQYSWFSSARNGFRLDHALLSPALAGGLAGAEFDHTLQLGLSDHSALVIDLDAPNLLIPT
jgi:exonuclease III